MDKEEEVSPSLVITLENIIEDLQEKIGELEDEVADLQSQLRENNNF